MTKAIKEAPPAAELKTNWRDSLEPDERATIKRAEDHVSFWTGIWSNSPLVLVAKLAKMLDEAYHVDETPEGRA